MTSASNTARAPRRAKTSPAPEAPTTATIEPTATEAATSTPKRRRAKPAAEPAVPGASAAAPAKAPGGKLDVLTALLKSPDGTTIEAMVAATGWQAHSVRGAMAGALKKKFGLVITSNKADCGRVYRAVADGTAS